MLETTVVGYVARSLATRAAAGIRHAIAGDDLERALVSILDIAAEQVADELAASRFGLSANELAEAIQEQIRSAAVQVSPDREEPSIAELLRTVLTEALAPWSSVPMYGAVTTEQHFGINVEDTVELLVARTLTGIRMAASETLDGLANEIRHDELLVSIRRSASDRINPAGASDPSTVDVRLAHFAIDKDRCTFEAYTYDPSKPLWPTSDTGMVTHHPNGDITEYGRRWTSTKELDQYRTRLRETCNHRAFSGPSEAIVLEFDASPEDAHSERSPLPVFYVVVANYGRTQAVLKQVGVDVAVSEPLAGIPESRALKSLATYEVPVPPVAGRHMRPAIPALRVAAEDAAAFHLRLCFAQGFATMARVVLDFGDQELLSSPVYLAF